MQLASLDNHSSADGDSEACFNPKYFGIVQTLKNGSERGSLCRSSPYGEFLLRLPSHLWYLCIAFNQYFSNLSRKCWVSVLNFRTKVECQDVHWCNTDMHTLFQWCKWLTQFLLKTASDIVSVRTSALCRILRKPITLQPFLLRLPLHG